LGSGHYYSFALNTITNKWFEFNDSTLTEIENPSDIKSNGDSYILFYKRKEEKPKKKINFTKKF
jgi:ubiquitin C-terminal hydrolase